MDRWPALEREEELGALAALAARVMGGAGGTIVLEAQPGLGKSTVLSEAGPPAGTAGGLRVLSFCCGELEEKLSWVAVRGLLARTPAPGELCAGVRAVFGLISRLAERSPLLLVLDDAHWSDAPSLHALTYLQRRLHALPVGLVVAMRPAAGTGQQALLERLQDGPDTEVHRLCPLSREAVAEVIRDWTTADADPAFCDACYERTAGNPFFLRELLAECRRRGIDPRRSPAGLGPLAPPKVRTALLQRLARLPAPGAAPIARAAAVLGDGVRLGQAAALGGVDEAESAGALDALSAAEVLRAGEPLRFVHPLARDAIYAAIPPAQRAVQHARAAAMLRAGHAPVERVADHLLHAPRTGLPAAVGDLRAAAARAHAQGAPGAAARYLRRALEEPPAVADRAQVLSELAAAETALGDPACVTHLAEELELADDGRRRAAILGELGWARHRAGQFRASADAFEQGLAIARALPDRVLGAELEGGFLAAARLDRSRMTEALRRATAIDVRAARGDLPAELLAPLLFTRTMAGAPHAATVELAQRLWADGGLLREAGAGSPVLWPVIEALSRGDAYGPALRAAELVLEAASERGLAFAVAQAHLARAESRYRMGRLAEVEADARFAIEVWHGGLEAYLPAAAYRLGVAELEQGNGDAAATALGLAGPAERWEGTGMAAFIHALSGQLALHAGRAGAALAAFQACGRVMDDLRIANPSVIPWRSDAGRALLVLGELEGARRLAEEELRVARACGAPRAAGIALRICGLARGGDAGIELLRQAVDLQACCGAALERARAEVDLGGAMRRQGRRRSARPYLQAGLARAQAAGATALARQAETELRAAGGRGRRLTDTGPGLLTASERRVAELAAQGYSNRSIAGLLQISIKGVEWHLHQSYRKLDIAGRGQLGPALLGGAR
jgi:DNA-binding CsgD family transcriptional regulator